MVPLLFSLRLSSQFSFNFYISLLWLVPIVHNLALDDRGANFYQQGHGKLARFTCSFFVTGAALIET